MHTCGDIGTDRPFFRAAGAVVLALRGAGECPGRPARVVALRRAGRGGPRGTGEPVRPGVPAARLHHGASARGAARDRRPPRRRGVDEAGRVGRPVHPADALPRAPRPPSPPSSRSSTTTRTSTSPSAPTTTRGKVHVYPGRRDAFGEYAVDVVGICFDSYIDKRTGFEFDLTAGGGKIDLILGNDGRGTRPGTRSGTAKVGTRKTPGRRSSGFP